MKRAQENEIVDLHIHNLRDWTTDKHHIVDDAPFGGGQGMVMKPEPIFAAVEELRGCSRGTSNIGPASAVDGLRRGERPTPNSEIQISRTDEPTEKFDVHTPGAPLIVEQIIRPTGLLDPKITLKPLKNQIDETIELCRQRVEKAERVLVTTLTKRTAEDLADYLRDVGLKVRYLHSDIDAIERVEILRGLRAADFDILVGINLLREGLDLPEVSLVCILDADKEGFLRSQTSLIQTAGRAARHVNGEVVLFADIVTQSMEALMSISEYRRAKQMDYNEKHGITPQTVRRAVQESLHTILRGREIAASVIREAGGDFNVTELLRELEEEMQEASANLEFERAALLRDQIMEVKSGAGIAKIEPKRRAVRYSRNAGRRRSRV